MLIGICGGIGSGKSVVSRILRLRGFAVYDCDLEAKRLMDESEEVLLALNRRFGDEVCPEKGPIDRKRLAGHVFSSDDHRVWLNQLVHGLVRRDVEQWSREREAERRDCFVESAIIASSGLAGMCDEIWLVCAPQEQRIARVKGRDGLSAGSILARIRSQEEELNLLSRIDVKVRRIDNGDTDSLLRQLTLKDSTFASES